MTVATNVPGGCGLHLSRYTPIDGEPFVTATATDAAGTTSEFSRRWLRWSPPQD